LTEEERQSAKQHNAMIHNTNENGVKTNFIKST